MLVFGLLNKPKPYQIPGWLFGFISSSFSIRRLQVLIDGKSSQEYPVNVGVPQQSILCLTLFFICTDELPDDICNVVIYADDTAFYLKYNEASDLWQLLLLVSELKI